MDDLIHELENCGALSNLDSTDTEYVYQLTNRAARELQTLKAALAVKDGHDHFDCTAERAIMRLMIEKHRKLAKHHRHYYSRIDEQLWEVLG